MVQQYHKKEEKKIIKFSLDSLNLENNVNNGQQ